MLMVAVMVYPTMVPHRLTYWAIPHMNTSLGPAIFQALRSSVKKTEIDVQTSREKQDGSRTEV